MNRTAFSLPEHSEYRTGGGLVISRAVEQFTGDAKRAAAWSNPMQFLSVPTPQGRVRPWLSCRYLP